MFVYNIYSYTYKTIYIPVLYIVGVRSKIAVPQINYVRKEAEKLRETES